MIHAAPAVTRPKPDASASPRRRVVAHAAAFVAAALLGGAPGCAYPLAESAAGRASSDESSVQDRSEFVTVGMDTVLRAEGTSMVRTGDSGGHEMDDQRLVPRLRPSVSVAPSPSLVATARAQWHASLAREQSQRFSVYEAFAEVHVAEKRATLKVGRQEIGHGSAFLLGTDTFLDGASFDAINVGIRPHERLSVNVFAGKYVEANSGGIEGVISGVYGTYAGDAFRVDLYGIVDTGGEGFTRERDERRTWSIGTRLAGNLGGTMAFEVEPVLQLGRAGGATAERIAAFGMHMDATLKPKLGRRPANLLLSYAFGSGDGDMGDGTSREFRNPNNDTPLIGDMGVIGDLSGVTVTDGMGTETRASGLHVLTVGAGLEVISDLAVFLDAHYFVAATTPAAVSAGIGREVNLTVTHGCNDQVTVVASVSRFFTGAFYDDAGGRGEDVEYGYIQFQSTF